MGISSTTFLSFLAGVGGTGMGGFYTFFLREVKADKMTSVLGFASGIMLTAVFSELIPEAIEISGLFHTLIGIIIGIMFLMWSDALLEFMTPQKNNTMQHFVKTGAMLFFAIASHNFPEGIAIGSGFEASQRTGLVLAVTLALHNIPEGMAIATAFRLSGMSAFSAFMATALAGFTDGFRFSCGTETGPGFSGFYCCILGFCGRGHDIHSLQRNTAGYFCDWEKFSLGPYLGHNYRYNFV